MLFILDVSLRTVTHIVSYPTCLLGDSRFASLPLLLLRLDRNNCCMLPRVALDRAL